MLSAYRQVLSTPGAAAFSASGFLARLPISMVTLGIVLLISARTDSYALAGGISAAFVIASCLAALLQGRLIDRLGQARVLRPGRHDLHGQPLAAGLGGRGRLPGAAPLHLRRPGRGHHARGGRRGPGPLDPRADQPGRAADRVRARGRGRRVRLPVRPAAGHRARHHGRPGRRPGRRDRLRTGRHPHLLLAAQHRATAAPGATPTASRSRCRGGGCSRSR